MLEFHPLRPMSVANLGGLALHRASPIRALCRPVELGYYHARSVALPVEAWKERDIGDVPHSA